MWKNIVALMLIGAAAGRVTQSFDTARMREAIEAQCKKNGAENRVEEIVQGMQTSMTCIDDLMDENDIAQVVKAQGPEIPKEIINFVMKRCKTQNEINQCFNNMFELARPCMGIKENATFEATKKTTAELTDLFCKDDSKKFAEFINDGGLQCLEAQLSNMLNCLSTLLNLKNYKTIATEVCDKVDDLTSCVVKKLNACPKPSTATFVADLFRIMIKSSNCGSHAEQKNITENSV